MKRQGLVLLELVTVIVVATVMAAVSVPNLFKSREMAKRAGCAMNLSNAGKAVAIYKACYEDEYPTIHVDILKPDAVTGTNFDADEPTELSTTATMFLLMRDGSQSARMYICPSTTDVEDDNVQSKNAKGNNEYHHDFSQQTMSKRPGARLGEIEYVEADQCSYGYAAPIVDGDDIYTAGVMNEDKALATALMADKGPAWGADPSEKIPTLNAKSSAADLKKANSQNHQGEYINYLRADFSVQKSESPIINGKDNIYTAFKGDDPFSNDAYGGTCEPDNWSARTSDKDSWIIGPKRK